jgi:hypothetical protein
MKTTAVYISLTTSTSDSIRCNCFHYHFKIMIWLIIWKKEHIACVRPSYVPWSNSVCYVKNSIVLRLCDRQHTRLRALSPIVLQNVGWNIDSIMLLHHQQYYCINMWLNIHSFTSFLIGISKNRLPTVPVPSTSCRFIPSTLNKDHQSAMHPIPIEQIVCSIPGRDRFCLPRFHVLFVSPYRKRATW